MIDFGIIPTAEASVVTLMKSIDKVIINPIIFFLFAAAMVYFLYGVAQYFISADNEEVRSNSKSHMMYGILGLFIMVAVFGIERIILNTLSVNQIKIQDNGDYVVNSTVGDLTTTSTLDSGDQAQLKALKSCSSTPDPVCGTDLKTYDNECEAIKAGVQVRQIMKDGVRVRYVGACPSLDNTEKDVSRQLTKDTEAINGDYTNPPFAGPPYTSDSLCWRKAVSTSATTEYKALQAIYGVARAAFLSENSVADSKVDKKFPFPLESTTLYDKAKKTYYVWWAAAVPLGKGTIEDCKRDLVTPLIPKIENESTKVSSMLGLYPSTTTYIRVIDSGVASTMQAARSTAIINALARVAIAKNLASIKDIKYSILSESYFPPNALSNNYDYFVALQVLR